MSVPKVNLNDGNRIPILGLGTGSLTTDSIRDAINCGYRHFDSAFVYNNEEIIGDVVNEAINDGIVKREEIFYVSKVWPTYFSKGRVIKSAKLSVEKCGLGYLDLLLLHVPTPLLDDDTDLFPKLPNGDNAFSEYDLMDVYRELEDVKRMGLAKSIGVSNFNSAQIERIVKIAEHFPVTNQVECHPYLSQEKLLTFCAQWNVTLTAFSPLGFRNRAVDTPPLLEDETLTLIANKYSRSVAQIILRWQTQRGVIVIPKSVNRERIKQNIDIFDFSLADQDMAAITALNRNYRYNDTNRFGFDAHKEYPFNIEF